jgi:hypothetical protein
MAATAGPVVCRVLTGLVLVIRFLSELALLAAFVAWGASRNGAAGWLAGLAAALLVATAWGLWVAPKATRRLPDPRRYALEVLLFAVGALAAWSAWGGLVAGVGLVVSLGAAWGARTADA